MYARSTIITGDPGRLDDGIAYVRNDVMPTIMDMDGCVGLSMLVDRDTGQCIVTSSWDTEDTMKASNLHLAPMRRRSGQIMGGPPEVDEWEVAVMHRDHPAPTGSCCRITWTRSTDTDNVGEMWRSVVLPRIESLQGFCSASFMIDRAGGRAVGTVVFDSREAMEATREASAAIREQGAREADVEFLDVAEFELALAHLRLPELV